MDLPRLLTLVVGARKNTRERLRQRGILRSTDIWEGPAKAIWVLLLEAADRLLALVHTCRTWLKRNAEGKSKKRRQNASAWRETRKSDVARPNKKPRRSAPGSKKNAGGKKRRDVSGKKSAVKLRKRSVGGKKKNASGSSQKRKDGKRKRKPRRGCVTSVNDLGVKMTLDYAASSSVSIKLRKSRKAAVVIAAASRNLRKNLSLRDSVRPSTRKSDNNASVVARE